MKSVVPYIKYNSKAFTKTGLALLLLLFCHSLAAQSFTLLVTPTNGTCTANGSLSFSVQNAAPGSPVTYTVYLLPDAATPVASGTATTASNLQPGNYQVEASQVVNGNTVTAIALASITTPQVPLAFAIQSISGLCNTGKLAINVSSGTAASYEIFSGPILRPQQASPVFTDLVPGVYQVRVTDVCGNSQTGSSVLFAPFLFTVGGVEYPSTQFPSCNYILTRHTIRASNLTPIPYPLTVRFIVQQEGGPTTVITRSIPTGNPLAVSIDEVLPTFGQETTSYHIEVTYPCGIIGNTPADVRSLQAPELEVTGSFGNAGCGLKFLKIVTQNYTAPYTINFTSAPTGFDPALYNTAYPGPFYDSEIDFGNAGLPAPIGFYQFTLTDACGATVEKNLALSPLTSPEAHSFNNDCVNQLGRAEITIPILTLAAGAITSAPPEYNPPSPIPYNVTGFIDDAGKLVVEHLPVGDYMFLLTDACGNNYNKQVTIFPYNASLVLGETRPDCDTGKGTIRVYAYNPPVNKVVIMQAPPAFPHALPYDASFNINADGVFYMDGLPDGQYYIRGYDECSVQSGRPVNIYITGNAITENEVDIAHNCGSFNLTVRYGGADSALASLWIQKEISPGVWGHPETGAAYTEGTAPVSANSYAVTAFIPVTGLTWQGHFRVVKYFETYASGGPTKKCLSVINDFYNGSSLEIYEIKTVSCPGPTADIEVVTNGVPPVNYKITHKNGSPYIVYNNGNPVFTNLAPAVYTFEVTDGCGGYAIQDLDLQAAPPLVVANPPGNLSLCDVGNDNTETFNLSLQDSGILGTQDPADFTITYFASQEDADLDWHPLPLSYQGPATIYARVVNNSNASCHATTSFHLLLMQTPVLGMPSTYAFCPGHNVTVTADAGYASYQWSHGPGSPSVTLSEPGQYTVTVTDANGCTGSKTIDVIPSPVPEISQVDISDWSDSSNTITIKVTPSVIPQHFEYSIDGINFGETNFFTNVPSGKHTVFVRDIYDCGIDSKEVYLLTYPKFFTPNGDGENDTWRIEFAIIEPNMEVSIYDRYGKLITSFGANSTGWDGTLNGTLLPSTDYWFVIKRNNGVEFRGHFSMLR